MDQPARRGKSRLIPHALAAGAALALAVTLAAPIASAQDLMTGGEPEPPAAAAAESAPAPIAAGASAADDGEIAARIRGIFAEVEGLQDVGVRVSSGVVTLSGAVPDAEAEAQAQAIAGRVAGVVTVQARLDRDLDVERNLTPALGEFRDDLRNLVRALPLIAVALAIAAALGVAGHLLGSWDRLWRAISPNVFLAELIATFVRVLFVVLGLVAGLELLGATALLGAVLGGAGIIGIALGFAVRDTVANYVSSLMLSLRQPFRANDHVVIEGQEGRVLRLTSRATVLMTLDGNHLRIPNATVFNAVILNYTRNPERRFEFDLGVDAEDDPVAAMAAGLEALNGLDFVLPSPEATAVIQQVGDSNIVLRFYGWVDQGETDFLKGRSLALHAVKQALEAAGFALPEPIYRLRFDAGAPLQVKPAEGPPARAPGSQARAARRAAAQAVTDTRPDAHIAKLVDEERAGQGEADLLDDRKPVE